MTFYFYDLETSGLNTSAQRIMQFGGIRTDENLNIIDEPFECYVKLTDEVIPDLTAVLVTGISPQKTLEEGYSEPEFIEILQEKVFQPNTVIVGYNNIRFDDEFIRNLMWRNLVDPYEWHWKEGRSRWDIVDITRMTRALRPEGIEWPFDKDEKPTNKLDKLTVVNKIEHSGAHTALADVEALIEFAKLLKTKQPKLFDFLLKNRSKQAVGKIVDLNDPKPFVHSSGKISFDFLSTSVFYPLFKDPKNPQGVICFDLRYDCSQFAELSEDQLVERIFTKYQDLEEKGLERLPIKGIHINKAPAVAPMGVLDEPSKERVKLTTEQVAKNLNHLLSNKNLVNKIKSVYSYNQHQYEKSNDADQQLYDGFVGDKDRQAMQDFRAKKDFAKYSGNFIDDRLNRMILRYKARNYPQQLSDEELQQWGKYKSARFKNGINGSLSVDDFMTELSGLGKKYKEGSKEHFLVQEMELYLQSILQ